MTDVYFSRRKSLSKIKPVSMNKSEDIRIPLMTREQNLIYNLSTDRPSHEKLLLKVEHPGYYDSLLTTKCDYYFVKIVEINGDMICSVEPHKAVTISIIVRLSKYNFKIKKDSIFYLKSTKGLKEKLSYVINIDDYIVKLND